MLHLVGTDGDDTATINGTENQFNELSIFTNNAFYNFTLDGKGGHDDAFVASDEYSHDFIFEDNHFNMNGGIYKADIVNVNSLNVIAQGRRDTISIYAANDKQTLLGISNVRASRIAENQQYHIYGCENVVVVNRDIENNMDNAVSLFGVKNISHQTSENAVVDNNQADFAQYKFRFQIDGFAPDRIILPHATQTTTQSQKFALTQALTQEIDPILETFYAYLADEQTRLRKNQEDLFADTEHWLDEFEELALLDTRK